MQKVKKVKKGKKGKADVWDLGQNSLLAPMDDNFITTKIVKPLKYAFYIEKPDNFEIFYPKPLKLAK